MVSNIAKDLSLPRHLPEGLPAGKLQRGICIAVILTSDTPNIAQETTISLVATEKVDLAISIHTMIGDVAIAPLAVTTTVEILMTNLMATGIINLATKNFPMIIVESSYLTIQPLSLSGPSFFSKI